MNPRPSEKSTLRTRLLAMRDALPPEVARAASEAVTKRLLVDPAVAGAGRVLIYLPVRNEIDTRDIFAALVRTGTTLLLPRCRPAATGELDLYRVECLDQVCPGRFGILEPDPGLCPLADATPPDVTVTPGVAFDRTGARLGFGGGYYDRLFSRPDMARTRRIGLAHDFQVVDRLPADPWDHPMHALCTPKELLWITP